MYCNYFGFNQKPFEVSPDPDFLYFTRSHREVLASLIYGIRERRGFIAVIGEVGTGKTTILNTLRERLGASHRCAFVFYGGKTFQAFINHVLVQLRLVEHPSCLSVQEAIQRLHDFARQQYNKGGNVVLIIDEAQNLDRDLLEQIRLLSNLETRKNKLIQIVLSGQVELEHHLNHYDLRQLAQRINLKRYVTALNYTETLAYIQHRIQLAGYRGPALFTEQALRLIRMESGGIPRKINVICDNALITTYGLNKTQVNSGILREVLHDLYSTISFKHIFKDKWEKTIHQMRTIFLSRGRTDHQEKVISRSHSYRYSTIFGLLLVMGITLTVWPFYHRDFSASTDPLDGPELSDKSKENIALYRIDRNTVDTQYMPKQNTIQETSGPPNDVYAGRIPAKTKATDPMVIQSRSTRVSNAATVKDNTFIVIVKKGDSLASIIRQYYGDFNEKLLMAVLKANRTIENVNKINIGQIISLPPVEVI